MSSKQLKRKVAEVEGRLDEIGIAHQAIQDRTEHLKQHAKALAYPAHQQGKKQAQTELTKIDAEIRKLIQRMSLENPIVIPFSPGGASFVHAKKPTTPSEAQAATTVNILLRRYVFSDELLSAENSRVTVEGQGVGSYNKTPRRFQRNGVGRGVPAPIKLSTTGCHIVR
ncbi:MAG: hypothetical protein IH969_10820 [Candidatus Krumholzibacteriota bacterium]|nr:hypothetical protein [Candidatus Krumholzibacteriota bacterium]